MWLLAILTDMQTGREQLQAWIKRRFNDVRGQQSEAADLLGVDQSYLSQLLSGRRQPGLVTAVAIERLTGIAVESWLPQSDGQSSTQDDDSAVNVNGGK